MTDTTSTLRALGALLDTMPLAAASIHVHTGSAAEFLAACDALGIDPAAGAVESYATTSYHSGRTLGHLRIVVAGPTSELCDLVTKAAPAAYRYRATVTA